MRTFTAADAKNRFGELLDAARREPVSIERHGRPVAVMISREEYAAYADAYDALLRDRIKQAEDDIRQGDVVGGDELLSLLRAKIDRGMADFEAGRTFSHQAVFAEIGETISKR